MSSEFHSQEEQQQPHVTAEEYLAAQKKSIRKKSWWAVGIGSFVVMVHVGWLLLFSMLGLRTDFSVLFRSIFFVLGLFAFAAGLYGLYYVKTLTIKDLIPTSEAIEFAQRSKQSTPYFSMILLGSIVAVFIAQLSGGLEESVLAAGFVRNDIETNRQYWRLLTVGTLHGGILHIFLNGNALYGLGGLVEYLSNRAHLAIVFVLSVIGGSTASLLFGPFEYATGASGGILGIFGYLLIYAYRRKQQLPPDFLKNLLVNVAFIAGFGIIAYQLVDNFAHVGGFLVGAGYAFIQVPRDLAADPRKTSPIISILGIVAIAVYIIGAAFAIFRIAGRA